MSKFVAAFRQDDCKGWAKMAAKATDEAKEMQNLIEELKADIIQKDSRLDHLQKKNDELSTLLKKAKDDVVMEFKASKQYIDLLDANYVVGFEDFCMDAEECLPDVNFNSIKLNIGVASFLLQMNSEDVNIKDDAITQPAQDDPSSRDNPQ